MTGSPSPTTAASTAAAATRPTRGVTRGLRVVVLGGMSLTLAAVAHVAGGGRLPSAGVLATAALLLGLIAATMTVRRCRFGVLLGVLVTQQVLLHLLFDAAQVSTGCGVTAMPGMHHAGHAAVPLCDPATVAAMDQSPAWAMWAAHLLATALTAALLAQGEAWLWRVADQIVQAATATPAGWPEPQRGQLVSGGPEAPLEADRRTPAEPRAPPLVLAVL